ncbi:HNH endonuclease [Bradyrhizobium sp. CCBAU 51753]|nr:HNH endonuclease [Bradyrhizobium sp. CCBAU 51753]QOZ26169.1 HNH endonuclease [Bradyrhizobium sp. CCBAU 51753]
MPMRPPRICSCGRKVASGVMCACQLARKLEADKHRPSASQRGYGAKWQRESKAFLALPQNRYCACGCGRIADCVDHIVPHRGDMARFWDRKNWQALASSPCHSSRKQQQERRDDR